MQLLIGLAVATLAALLARRARAARLPARALIVSPPRSTVIAGDGSVRSVQSARLQLSTGDLDRLWCPENLENLGRTYWRYLTRATLGLIRVAYTERDRAVRLFGFITLLRFQAPEYVLEPLHGRINWRIKSGLLVARSGRGCGCLALDVRREPSAINPDAPAEATIEVEVENFYPAIAAGIGTLVYESTQNVVHVLVTHSFLRSLATLELAESKVGALRDD